MKITYQGNSCNFAFIRNKEYRVFSKECGKYRIWTEFGETYLFGIGNNLKIVEGSEEELDVYSKNENGLIVLTKVGTLSFSKQRQYHDYVSNIDEEYRNSALYSE